MLAKQASVNRAIGSIGDDAWVPVHYPGSFTDPDTGELVSDEQVAEVSYTAFAEHPTSGHRPADPCVSR